MKAPCSKFCRMASILASSLVVASCASSNKQVALQAPNSSSPSTAATSLAAAGFNGPLGWRVTSSQEIQVTDNGGSSWQNDIAPAGVNPSDLASISRSASGAVLAASVTTAGLVVYRQKGPGQAWTSQALTPRWPPGFQISSTPDSILFASSPAGVSDVVVEKSIGMTTDLVATFEASGGGDPYVQTMSRSDYAWHSVAFDTALDGVAVAGPVGSILYSTTDGGKTWSAAKLPAAVASSHFSPAMLDGGAFEIVAYTTEPSGAEKAVLMHSSDGASFTVQGVPVVVPSQNAPGELTTATFGSDVWIFADHGVFYTSRSAGGSWAQRTSSSLPNGITAASLLSATNATVVWQQESCGASKSNCVASTEVRESNDEGVSWTSQ